MEDLEWNISAQNEINEITIRRKNVEGESENSIDLACIQKIHKNIKKQLLNGFKDEIKKQLARHIRKKASMDLEPQVLEPTRTGYKETGQKVEEETKRNVQDYWNNNITHGVTDCLILNAPYKEDTIAQIFEQRRIEHFRDGYDISEILGLGLGLGLPYAVRVQCTVQSNNKVATINDVVDRIEHINGHSVFGDMKYIPDGAIIESVDISNQTLTLNKNAKNSGKIPITIKKPMYINNFFETTEYQNLPDELFVRISPEEAHMGRNMGRNTDKFSLIDPTFNNKQYYLHAFVVHGGNNLNSGHYRAFVKRQHLTDDEGPDQWWHCNDSSIQPANDTELQSYLKKRVYKTNIVYVCYYHTTKQSSIREKPIGRVNNSNWCWMNAGMQCLLTVPSIRSDHSPNKKNEYTVQQTLDTREKMITIKTTCDMDGTKVLKNVPVNRMRVGQSIKPGAGRIERGTDIVSIGKDGTLTLNQATKAKGTVEIEFESIYGQSGKKFKNDVVPKFATTTSRKRKRPQSTMLRSKQQDPMEWLIRPVLESRSVSFTTTKKRFFAPPGWWNTDDTSWRGPDFLATCSLDNIDALREEWKKRLEHILFVEGDSGLEEMDIENDIEKNTPDDCYNTIIKNNEDISLLIALCAR